MKKFALAASIASILCLAVSVDTGLAGGSQALNVNSIAFVEPVAAGSAPMSYQEQNMTIGRYCFRCHNDQLLTGGLSLESFDAEHAYENAEIAEKMIRKLRVGMMPPKEAQQPDAATKHALAMALETSIDEHAARNPNPGRRTFQRLNRAEYVRAIRDLLGIEIDPSTFLPPDTISASFDNIADVQMPSATVMEGYLRAAGHVSRAAIGDPFAGPDSTVYPVPRTQSQKKRVDGAPFGTRGGVAVVHNFPADGKYEFRMLLHGEPTGLLFGRTLLEEQIEVSIDGERVGILDIDRWLSEMDPTGLTITVGPVDVRAGAHTVAAAFLAQYEGGLSIDDLVTPIDNTLADTQIGVGYGVETLTHLRDLSIVGPFNVTGVSDNPTRRRIFTCRPTSAGEELPCAKSIISRLAAQAYRRPVDDSDIASLTAFYNQGAVFGGFEGGIGTALQAILTSPYFVFRTEETPAGVAPGSIYPVNDIAFASRLSFFIWSTPPDQELIDLAARGQLSDPEIIDAQVRRMLADPRAESLATRFAGLWLRIQDLDKVDPDALSFPYYDKILANSMHRETELLFAHLVAEDRNILELLTADYTFANERLARHYGIPGVTGSEFRRVNYPDDRRRGVLGHGSILTMTSEANRTSPVKRGKWVMEVLLGSPPPAPPPNIPDLEETGQTENGRFKSVADQLAEHRANPACSSCHNMIDPLGLSLDNFDVTGAWRIKDRGVPINTEAVMYDGTELNGPADLTAALLKRSDVIITHFTGSLMSYAMGRRVEYYDMPGVREIIGEAEKDDYRISSFILGIVNSDSFRMARAETTEEMGLGGQQF
ncbi:MAG: hypothetical protein CL485_10195 [Acidobacteria bacterium]|nr:hypothetical protein [Acidobacteriota bacterium]|tara:strand:- start:4356 stop:6827 length:2472 start_codon:yes stop_codon:yes gene_type:complete